MRPPALREAFKDPCLAPDETVTWLEAQPEVSGAANHQGHNLSYLVDDLPFILSCHRR